MLKILKISNIFELSIALHEWTEDCCVTSASGGPPLSEATIEANNISASSELGPRVAHNDMAFFPFPTWQKSGVFKFFI